MKASAAARSCARTVSVMARFCAAEDVVAEVGAVVVAGAMVLVLAGRVVVVAKPGGVVVDVVGAVVVVGRAVVGEDVFELDPHPASKTSMAKKASAPDPRAVRLAVTLLPVVSTAPRKSSAQRELVCVLEVSTDGEPTGQPGNSDLEWPQE